VEDEAEGSFGVVIEVEEVDSPKEGEWRAMSKALD
jgi:hypothetical protein